jgi:hypothetical protein
MINDGKDTNIQYNSSFFCKLQILDALYYMAIIFKVHYRELTLTLTTLQKLFNKQKDWPGPEEEHIGSLQCL